MFLIPEKHLVIALEMNTYSLMLGIRVQRVPSSVLRMLIGQTIIPGYKFPYMRIVYALVMLIPLLHIITIFTMLSHLFLAEQYATANTDADCTSYRFAVDLERCHRLYTFL
jgi:hypothetical protein